MCQTVEGVEPLTTPAPVMSSQDLRQRRLLTSAKIVERMLNLNTFGELARDYRFYEDPADEFKDGEGTLLPLWTFKYVDPDLEESFDNKTQRLQVTDLQWNPKYGDLFAVSYGSYDFYKTCRKGFLCLFSLKNPSYPEYICSAGSGILCVDTHPSYPHIIAVGLYDGNVAVYDLSSSSSSPCYQSSAASGKHADAVWLVRPAGRHQHRLLIRYFEVKWAKDNLDGYLNFFSCSGDGRVTNWTIVKTSLWHSDFLQVDFTKTLTNVKQDDTDMKDGVRTIAFKPDDDSLYLIGTDEGNIYLCTTEYSTAFIMSYYAHITPVNTVVWNTFYPSLFLSCASEQTIYFWHKDLAGRITDETDLLL